MKKCVVLFNKYSGREKKKDFFQEFKRILEENDYSVELINSNYKGHIVDIVKDLDEDVDLVISMGGDGTFNESMRGNFKRRKKLVLAHIPTGTTNDVGKMFGYGKDPIENLKELMNGTIKRIDICTINDVPFIYVAGFGKYMNIPYETKRKTKKIFGYLAYVGNGIKNFFKRTEMHKASFEVNGEKYDGVYSFITITNTTRIAGVKVFDNIKLDDNKAESLFCSIKKRKDIIKALLKLKKNNIANVSGIQFYSSNMFKIIIENEKELTWCLDGEEYLIKNNEVIVKVDSDNYVMIPKKNINELFKNK